ncbi:MAG: DUF4221 domain-containing protein [Porphyromonadaceae bacterium]|nr:MAG: DUF4221 domain-containing protein [Porphyromonadaceae bacterium]
MPNYKILFRIAVISILSLQWSCSQEVSNNKDSWEIQLSKISQKIFILDSVSLPYSNSFQFFENDSKRILSFVNHYNNSIYFYNYDSLKLEYIWKPKESISVDKYIDGHFIVNNDTIVIFNYRSNSLNFYDKAGNCLTSYELFRDKSQFAHPPVPVIGTFNPLLIKDSLIFCTGFIAGEYKDAEMKQRPVVIKYNIQSKKIDYYVNYPDIYSRYNWGGSDLRKVYSVVFGNKVIVSFPLNNNLIWFDTKNLKEYVKETLNNLKFHPIRKSKDRMPTKEEIGFLFFSNYSYGPVLYDKFNNLIYRIVYEPAPKPKKNDAHSWYRLWWIDIFDENYGQLGRQKMEDSLFSIKNMFVTEEGLNFQVFTNDNEIKLFLLQPKKKVK